MAGSVDKVVSAESQGNPSEGTRSTWGCSWSTLLFLMLAAGCNAGNVASFESGGGSSAQNTLRPISASGSTPAGSAQPAPVRMNRALFEQPMDFTLQLRDTTGKLVDELGGAVDWVEYPPTAAAPAPDAIADFRDHDGCVWFESGVGLCFKVMGDVSSVGLNSREMRSEGLLEWAHARAPGIQSIQLVRATRDSSGFQVSFDAIDDRGEHYSLRVALYST